MKKKIVILSLTLGFGGIEKYISSLCNMFQNDFDIEIICNYKETNKPAFNFYNAKIKYLINECYSNVSIKKLIKEVKILDLIKEIIKRIKFKYNEKNLMIKELKKIDCNYIITTRIKHNKLVNKYVKKKGIIKIATEHNFYDIEPKYDIKLVNSVKNFDYFILVSKELREHYLQFMDSKKCIYIPNVIDYISNSKSCLPGKNIISVGRFSPEKGFLDLIEVMKKVVKLDKEVKLFLIGDGYQKDIIKYKINEYGLNENIILTGYKNPNEQEQYYLKSSLYVMTSLSESFGIVLLESMNYGVPCIAFSSAKGAKKILNDVNFPIIEDRNTDNMAKLIVKLLNDKDELFKMQNNGKIYIKKYSLLNIKKMWDEIINVDD